MEYHINRRFSDNGHIIFEVEHFRPDGSSIGLQYYTFQGRVGHRTNGLSWESVLQTIESIHPKMVTGELVPDKAPPKMAVGKPYDFTGVVAQERKAANLNCLNGLRRSRGDALPRGLKPSPRAEV